MLALLNTYTQSILAYSFEQKEPAENSALNFKPEAIEKAAERIWRLSQSSGRSYILLLGVGNGELPKALLQKIEDAKIESAKIESAKIESANTDAPLNTPNTPAPKLIIADLDTIQAQSLAASGGLDFLKTSSSAQSCALLADSSSRALVFILAGLGLTPKNTVFYIHPELDKSKEAQLRKIMNILQKLTPLNLNEGQETQLASGNTFSGNTFSGNIFLGESLFHKQFSGALSELSVLCIMHPEDCGEEDTHLQGFIKALPPQIKELIIVWDSSYSFEKNIAAPFSIKQHARALANDFAAQRNFALSFCSGSWTLALDADERLPPNAWQSVMAAILNDEAKCGPSDKAKCEAAAFFLPRVTFYPDKNHFRAGFGLWPDLQLRLFKHTKEVRFERPIHEILTGVSGNTAFLLHAVIEHYSYLFKDEAALKHRLGKFNSIAGRELHKLNKNFPTLPLSWYENFCKLAQTMAFILPQGA